MRAAFPRALAILAVVATAAAAATPAAAPPDNDANDYIHRAVGGDTLIALAKRFMIDPRAWPSLQKLNRIADPHRIRPGTPIRIPLAQMKTDTAPMTVAAVEGPVDSSRGKLMAGSPITEDTRISTGDNGFVTLKLADGSTIVLQSQSQASIERARTITNTAIPVTRLALTAGRVEATVQKRRPPAARFEITTPTSNLGVRGTQFRVSADPSGKSSRGEVIEGEVSVNAGTAAPLSLSAGFGTVIEAGQAPIAPVPLLAAPDLGTAAVLQERILLRFKFAPLAAATGYRAQIASDREFTRLRADREFKTPEARFGDLPDGHYFLRVRAVDKLGIEGADAMLPFTLKARPEPPFTSAPLNKDKFAGTGAAFKWARAAEAASYRFQLARDMTFKQILSEERAVRGEDHAPAVTLIPGEYYWRVASIRADGDAGPFGDPQSFTLKPLPAAPNPPKEEGGRVTFTWGGEPGQKFDFQLARDEKFTQLVRELKLDKPEVVIDKPGEAGLYHMRFRAIDPDGFVGPFSGSQTIEVKRNYWWLLLLLLVPLAL